VCPKLRRKNRRPEIFEQTPLCDEIANVRNVVKNYGLSRKKRRRKAWQCGVFGSAYLDLSVKRLSAAY
jgi:hypothetical protein